MKISKFLPLLALASSVSAYADSCYEGKFELPAKKGAIYMSFKMDIKGDSGIFNSTVLNPDDTITGAEKDKSGKPVEKEFVVKDVMANDDQLKMSVKPGKDPGVITYANDNGDILFMLKDQGGDKLIALNYQGVYPVPILEIGACAAAK